MNPNWRWADHHQAVLSTCSSLIAIVDDGGSKVVQFSHFSVKEYLTSDRLAHSSWDVSRYHIALEPAHTILAQASLGVLLRLDDDVDKSNVGDIPLVTYAAQYWFNHVQFERVALRIRDAMAYFFDVDKPHWKAWCRVERVDEQWWGFRPFNTWDDPGPLYCASLGGFYDMAEHLIGKNLGHINAMCGRMGTPLVAVLRGKHFEVAELLHRNGADVDVHDTSEDTLLREACKAGALDIIQWLLNHGVDVNSQGLWLRTPLHSATDFRFYPFHHSSWSRTGYRGTGEGIRLLLKHGANMDAEDDKGRTPLQLALELGFDDVATYLKEHGATQ